MQIHQGVLVFCPWSKVVLPMGKWCFDAGQKKIGSCYIELRCKAKFSCGLILFQKKEGGGIFWHWGDES